VESVESVESGVFALAFAFLQCFADWEKCGLICLLFCLTFVLENFLCGFSVFGFWDGIGIEI
jgi:hypothetical protein